ncbi:hypothetical protein [Gracilibacillus sp. YIM 98692]|uniref:hypothetical protein n=1 Tax=Gracilibacillus sp. YIM 98692 TaxID=2663532 RepID=UPI0013D50835|nr:hypothetical protein [Gracilibacillus sp. YIM 98692]
MEEKDDLKHIEQKIERYSKISMSDKDFKNIHQKLMNAANRYDEKERKGIFMKKIGIGFSSVIAFLLILILVLSINDFTSTDEYISQGSKGSDSGELSEKSGVEGNKSKDTGEMSIEEIKERAITEVLEKYSNKSRKDVKARIGNIIEIDDKKDIVLFEGEISKDEDGIISFTPMEEQLVDRTLVGKKVLTIGNNSLFYSDPLKGGLYKVIVLDN